MLGFSESAKGVVVNPNYCLIDLSRRVDCVQPDQRSFFCHVCLILGFCNDGFGNRKPLIDKMRKIPIAFLRVMMAVI